MELVICQITCTPPSPHTHSCVIIGFEISAKKDYLLVYFCTTPFKCYYSLQSKITELDARLSALSQDKAKISEKISVLLANIDKINPNRKSSSLKTIRYNNNNQYFNIVPK